MMQNFFPVAPLVVDVFNFLYPTKCWVVGGAVRDQVLGRSTVKDVDLVVADEDFSCSVSKLSSRYGEVFLNRYGNVRFCAGSVPIMDVWSPGRFFCGYKDVIEMFRGFDFNCNCVAISNYGEFISSPSALFDIRQQLLSPIDSAWAGVKGSAAARLVGRALRMSVDRGFSPVQSPFFELAIDRMDADVLGFDFGFSILEAKKILL